MILIVECVRLHLLERDKAVIKSIPKIWYQVLIPPPLNSGRGDSPDSESSERSSEDPVNIPTGNDAPSVDKLPKLKRMLEPLPPQQESRVPQHL